MNIKHSHEFVDRFKGFIGFGLNRKSNEDTVIYYLQKFSDDILMEAIRERLTNNDLEKIFNLLSILLKKHLSEPEYHHFFLKKMVESDKIK